jgi:sRNA-binding carbon storage regulator CsrA
MALVLSLKNGDDVLIGDSSFVVGQIRAANDFDMVDSEGTVHTITDAESTEIMEDVLVSAGSHPPLGTVRVAIEAPKGILILRGDKLRSVGVS